MPSSCVRMGLAAALWAAAAATQATFDPRNPVDVGADDCVPAAAAPGYAYYGARRRTTKGEDCLPWHRASLQLLAAKKLQLKAPAAPDEPEPVAGRRRRGAAGRLCAERVLPDARPPGADGRRRLRSDAVRHQRPDAQQRDRPARPDRLAPDPAGAEGPARAVVLRGGAGGPGREADGGS